MDHGAFCEKGRSKLAATVGSWNGTLYTSTLPDYVLPFGSHVFQKKCFLKQDRAFTHSTDVAKRRVSEKKALFMRLPSKSLDLNPMGNNLG